MTQVMLLKFNDTLLRHIKHLFGISDFRLLKSELKKPTKTIYLRFYKSVL